jgi:hypothetical protein
MRVLVCPLDWGMGHTTRMIPVAARLINEGHDVTFGGSEKQLRLIRSDLPAAATMPFPGFTTRYSTWLPMYLYTAFRIPAFFIALIREHRQLDKILAGGRFDMVISDNRMGLWNRRVKTVYVTHMLRLPMPRLLRFLERPGSWLHRQFINRFDECMIPDSEGEDNLSGRLAHGVRLPKNARYIGILSKFTLCREEEMIIPPELTPLNENQWSVLILSGPEPQRSLLRRRISESWSDPEELLVVLEGRMGSDVENRREDRAWGEVEGNVKGNVKDNAEGHCAYTRHGSVISVPHLQPCAMAAVIKGSRRVFSRSGYTTIMELASIGRLDSRAILTATPGQTEQEYLARAKPWLKSS